MDFVSEIILLLNLLQVIGQTGVHFGPSPIVFASANLVDWPQFEPVSWFGGGGGSSESAKQPATQPAGGGGSSESELEARTRLAGMLASTCEKLSLVAPFDRSLSNCAEFNWTLSEASREMNNLVELAGDVQERGAHSLGKLVVEPQRKANSLLHEDADELRKLAALNAYEALGSAVSLYFECLSQLGQLGSVQHLNELLPIGLSMGTLGGFVDQVAQGGGEFIEFASLPGHSEHVDDKLTKLNSVESN